MLSSHILFVPLLCNHMDSDVKRHQGYEKRNFSDFMHYVSYLAFFPDKLHSRYEVVGGERGWTRPICVKAGLQDEATPQSYIHILHMRFYTSDERSIVWLFSSLRLMLVKGKGGHCPLWPAGMFWASQNESVERWGPTKCQAHMAMLI